MPNENNQKNEEKNINQVQQEPVLPYKNNEASPIPNSNARQNMYAQNTNLRNNNLQSGKAPSTGGIPPQAKKMAGKAASTAAKAVPGLNVLASTPMGKKLIEDTVNNTLGAVEKGNKENGNKSPNFNPMNMLPMGKVGKGLKLAKKFLNSGNEGQKQEYDAEGEVTNFLKKMIKPSLITIGPILLMFLIIFVVLNNKYGNSLGPILKSESNLGQSGTVPNNANPEYIDLLGSCQWATSSLCDDEKREKFYDEVKVVSEAFKEEYGVKLNTILLTATLAYQDIDEEDDSTTYTLKEFEEAFYPQNNSKIDYNDSRINYRKIRQMVWILADKMAPLKVQTVENTNEDGDIEKQTIKTRTLDETGYRKFLEDTFVLKYYLANDKSEKPDVKAKDIVKDIYSNVEFYKYVASTGKSHVTLNSQCNFNMTMVNVVSCSNKVTLASVPLKDYIIGVVYGEIGYNASNSDEYYKTMMIAAKTYGLSRGRYTSDTKSITIRSCSADQNWCDVNTGCYMDYENADSTYKTTYPMGFDLNIAGSERNIYKQPLSEEGKEALSRIYDEVANYLYLDESYTDEITSLGAVNEIPYGANTQNTWKELANEGNDYKRILELTGISDRFFSNINEKYSGKRLYDLSRYCKSTGYSGNGDYKIKIDSNGSINVDHPIDFFSQCGANGEEVTLSGTGNKPNGNKVMKATTINTCYISCGPTSFSMIVSAIGNISYLDEYFTGLSITGGNNDEKMYTIAKMHRYLADYGIQDYYGGGLGYSSAAYNDTIYAPLGIKYVNHHRIGSITAELIYNYLLDGNLIMYNIQSAQCDRSYGVGTACGAFGNTSGGHFGVIYGYDAATDEFLIYDPVKKHYTEMRVSSRYVPKLNSISVWGGV